EAPWHAAFPTPSFDSPRMSHQVLAEMMAKRTAGVDYIVVDVRRTDFETEFIKGAINLPAHSFYPTLPTITTLLSSIPDVIFHCSGCSQTGRGPRAAGWYAAELQSRGIETSKAWILDGGVKQFGAAYRDNSDLVTK
ncbi:hypothetical protein BDV93DRAFT_398789, partial [Ceratobasidium sp. AG-I]